MKKLIVTCVLIAGASAVSFAQSSQTSTTTTTMAPNPQGPATHNMPTPEMMAERRAKMYEKQFTLTPEQYKGVYNAELEFMKKHQEIRASGKQPTAAEAQQWQEEKDKKFKAAMSAEQYSKYEATMGHRPMPTAAPAPAPTNK